MERLESRRSFGGTQEVWKHASDACACDMRFSVFRPSAAEHTSVPVLYFLSGLTCTEQNFITKAGAQRFAEEHGLLLVGPDTSPRGEHVHDVPAENLGSGAGFYVNATEEPWAQNYRMYDYVAEELPALIEREFPATAVRSIFGHSMGGHGALVVALRNPGRYRSVSALAPIAAPSQVPFGQNALKTYLGADTESWKEWDTVELLAAATERLPLLVDQGEADPFLKMGLRPDLLEDACARNDHPLTLRRHPGYDHGYYFIATFVGDHIAHHAAALQ
ncbi:MAG: S-formylglutathione hydrolase [Myxococcota bacterium]